jgi:hypothetical protein
MPLVATAYALSFTANFMQRLAPQAGEPLFSLGFGFVTAR